MNFMDIKLLSLYIAVFRLSYNSPKQHKNGFFYNSPIIKETTFFIYPPVSGLKSHLLFLLFPYILFLTLPL